MTDQRPVLALSDLLFVAVIAGLAASVEVDKRVAGRRAVREATALCAAAASR